MWEYIFTGIGLYLSLIVFKYIICREGFLYVASEMAGHGYIEKHRVRGAAMHIGVVSSLSLVPFLIPLLYKERLKFFMPYPKNDLKYFAEHGHYPR